MFKRYTMTLKLNGPLHIGSGEQKSTKEYIYSEPGRRVYFPNGGKLIENIEKAGRLALFQQYVAVENQTTHLAKWLNENKIEMRGLAEYPIPYVSPEPDRPAAIDQYIKDGNGNHYIPGSSVKGMLRTIIERETGQVADQFSYWNKLSVSDSTPISKDSVIICGKVYTQGPVFLECIKPGVQLEIDIVVKSEEIDRLLPKQSKDLLDGMPFNMGKGGGNQSKSLEIRNGYDDSNVDKFPKSVTINGQVYRFGDVEWTIEAVVQ